MFGQIIDLLVKKDEERLRISLLLLKMAFTITLTTKLYLCLLGPFSIIPITDFQGIINYFLKGEFIICFALFFLIWIVSYDFISIVLFSISLRLTAKAYVFLSTLSQITPIDIKEEIENSPALKKYLDLLNATDIIEYENNTIIPGSNFYNFYDYLLDVKEGKKTISTGRFSSKIALIIQLVVIYISFEFDHFSYSNWLLFSAMLILLLLFSLNFLAYNIATLIEIKHSRILNILKIIEPSYEKHKFDRQSKNATTKSCQ